MSGEHVTAIPADPPRTRVVIPWRRVGWGALGLLIVLMLVAALALLRAAHSGGAGKAELTKAENDVLAERFGPAHQELVSAEADFRAMNGDLHGLPFGPAMAFWRIVPLARVQVRAVDTFATIGVKLSQAGLGIDDAATAIEQPSGHAVALSGSLSKLRTAAASLQAGVAVLDAATDQIDSLSQNHYRLLGPIGRDQREALTRLTRLDATAHSAEQAITALIAFTGGNGPRQYIVMSQNPDEVRPTGGFMGSYGVLAASGGEVKLATYGDANAWVSAHPTAILPAAQVGSPFRFYEPPLDETFADTNAVPDWPTAAQVALKLWALGGETPANGVVSFTPQFMARILAVTGPVQVPSYNVTVNADNVVSILNFYTHGEGIPPPGVDRKEFLSPLGQAVMSKLLAAPASEWRALGQAVDQSFTARDLVVWSNDPAVQSVLAARNWDGALPATTGDFFDDSEFEYGAKNGSGLKRTFVDDVTINADGSGEVSTTITVDDTEAASPVNNNPLTYYTLYGPAGAVLDPDTPDPPFSPEPDIAGHPAYGWFMSVAPMSSGTIQVIWDVPALAQQLSDGSWQYNLNFQHLVDNTGDQLTLNVKLPANAAWIGKAPPAHVRLNRDVISTWTYRIGS